jgi:hypothetical protein
VGGGRIFGMVMEGGKPILTRAEAENGGDMGVKRNPDSRNKRSIGRCGEAGSSSGHGAL